MSKIVVHHPVIAIVLPVLMGLYAIWPLAVGSQEGISPARGMFLVASRQIQDPLFMESVVLLLSYDENGAMGLIINKPSDRSISSMFPEMKKSDRRKDRLHFGGPVSTNQLLMLLRSKETPKDTTRILEGIVASTDRTVLLDALKKKHAGSDFRLYAGYSGWVAGQLGWEIKRGDWFVLPADAATVFNDDESKVWPLLIRKSQEITVQAPSRILDKEALHGTPAMRYARWR